MNAMLYFKIKIKMLLFYKLLFLPGTHEYNPGRFKKLLFDIEWTFNSMEHQIWRYNVQLSGQSKSHSLSCKREHVMLKSAVID